ILHHDFVSWDIAIDVNGKPVFIEANFAGATWLYQLATQKPLFGELTEEILQHVSHKLSQNISRDIKRSRGRKKRRNKTLKQQLKKQKRDIRKLKSQIKDK